MATSRDVQRAVGQGAAAFLAKPYTGTELLRTIGRVLRYRTQTQDSVSV
jgi:FixJ family two-component response regulator